MKTTKNVLLGLVVILTLLIFFQACTKSTITDIPEKYIIKEGETIHIPQNTKLGELTFLNYTDSRCPINAYCVWQGAALANFKIKTDREEQNIELCLGGCEVIKKNKKQKFVVNGVLYEAELIELHPYPGMDKTTEIAQATVLVQKK